MNADERNALAEKLFVKKWSQTRQKGRSRHAWIMAAAFGIVFGIVPVIIDAIRRRGAAHILIDVAITFLSAGGGYFLGIKSWNENECRFLAIQRVNPPATPPDQHAELN